MHVFTKAIETKRFSSVPGMPLPSRLDNAYGRKYLRTTYGKDVIAEVDYRDPDSFVALLGNVSDGEAHKKFGQLKLLADTQAKRIRELEGNIARLEKELRRFKGDSA